MKYEMTIIQKHSSITEQKSKYIVEVKLDTERVYSAFLFQKKSLKQLKNLKANRILNNIDDAFTVKIFINMERVKENFKYF